MSGVDTSEHALADAVSLDNLTRHNAEIAKGVRLSGSADEAEAFAYIAAQCRSYRDGGGAVRHRCLCQPAGRGGAHRHVAGERATRPASPIPSPWQRGRRG